MDTYRTGTNTKSLTENYAINDKNKISDQNYIKVSFYFVILKILLLEFVNLKYRTLVLILRQKYVYDILENNLNFVKFVII